MNAQLHTGSNGCAVLTISQVEAASLTDKPRGNPNKHESLRFDEWPEIGEAEAITAQHGGTTTPGVFYHGSSRVDLTLLNVGYCGALYLTRKRLVAECYASKRLAAERYPRGGRVYDVALRTRTALVINNGDFPREKKNRFYNFVRSRGFDCIEINDANNRIHDEIVVLNAEVAHINGAAWTDEPTETPGIFYSCWPHQSDDECFVDSRLLAKVWSRRRPIYEAQLITAQGQFNVDQSGIVRVFERSAIRPLTEARFD